MRRVSLAAALVLLAGCSANKAYVAKEYISAGRVAVLPLENQSNDLDGPDFVRKLLFEGLARRGFMVLPLVPIDAQLKANGFNDGGQLAATTPQKIGEWTGADTLLYTTLEDFDYINIGFYAQRRVKILSRLVDARTGVKLWEAEREGSTRVLVTDKQDAEVNFAVQLAAKAVEKMTHLPLQRESVIAVETLLNCLPHR